MRIVTEDPTASNGVREYQPDQYGYDERTGTWDVVLESDAGEDVTRTIPRERVVYVETQGRPR